MKNYKEIINETYTAGIYDNCDLIVEVNQKADKYRITYDYVKWVGNSGSLSTAKKYMPGKIGRKVLRRYALTKHQDGYCDLQAWME